MNNIFKIFAVAVLLTGCGKAAEPASEPVDYVNVKIGSGGHGHVFVGASVPFGAVQLGPTSIPQSWDWCSGYHSSDSTVIGFSHMHLSGTGIGDLFDITVMPVVGEVTYARGFEKDQQSGLWSYADRSKEIAEPGYYSVPLERYGVLAEVTATERVGFHRYTFGESDESALVLDLENGGCWDHVTEVEVNQVDSCTISGFRRSSGWARDQKEYFYAVTSRPADSVLVVKEGRYSRLCFSTSEGEQILMKVALSPNSVEGAKANLEAELPGWDFDATRKAARTAWNEELSKIKVEGKDEDAKQIFYTALYHTAIHPSLFDDAADSPHTYSIFSLWDTYRALMPLESIINPSRVGDFMCSFLDIFDKSGKLPVWHLTGNETDCMVGNPGIVAMADAVVKGIEGFDTKAALEAMKASAMLEERGMGYRMKYGYIPYDLHNESVACDLEYAIADAALANAAEKLGDTETHDYFTERSHSYRNYFDPETRFLRGKDSKGKFIDDFNPFYSNHRADVYCEGNGWQYAWLVPHDFEGHVKLFGSKEAYLEKLDSLFIVSSEVLGEEKSSDISGMIGQYAHGNEPSHSTLYLYAIAGEPGKCAEKVREVLNTLYVTTEEGLPGNEDAGQMSAWYVLSSIGFYQAEPASTRFWFGSPLFDKVSIEVPGGVFEVVAEGNSAENMYIQKASLNGVELDRNWIEYDEIMAGCKLEFVMGPSAVPAGE